MALSDRIRSDLRTIFNTNGIAEEAIYGTEGKAIPVIFNDAYEGLNMRVHVTMGTTNPHALAIDTDIADNPAGDIITIRSKQYNIVNYKPDGTGITVLILSTDNE